MADEKIQLTLSGKYTAGEAFTQANKDIKEYQKAHKDMVGAAKNGLSSLAGTFDGELSGSIMRTHSVLQQIANGGLWGIMSAAVSEMVGYFKRCSEEAEALKKRMDDMRTGYQKLLQEQSAAMEALKQDELDNLTKKAEDAVAAVDRLAAAFRGLAAAEDAAIGAGGQLKIAQINDEFSQRLAEACDELKPLVQAERDLAVAVQQQQTAREQQTRAIEREKVALAEVEQKIELQKKVIDAEVAAGRDTADAYAALSKLQAERAAQAQRLQNAETQAEISALHHQTALRDANVALEKARLAWDKAVEENERQNEKAADLAYVQAQAAKITRVCMVNQADANTYIKLFKDAIEKGMTETEAYAELQKKLNEDLKKRAQVEEKAANGADMKGGAIRGSSAHASASVHIDPNEVGRGVSEWDGRSTYSSMRKQMSADIQEQKNEEKRMNTELLPFINLLKGNMPDTMAEAYRNKLLKDFSAEQIWKIGEKAIAKQMPSAKEQREQLREIKKMVKCLENQGLK